MISTEEFLDAPQFLDGSAYLNHVQLVRKARGAEMPEEFWTDPLMYQGCSQFTGPTAPIKVTSEDYGIDYEAEVGIIVDYVPMGTLVEDTEKYIQYVLLINDVSLRNLIPKELSKGFGFLHGKPPSSLSPYALTPKELGENWKDCKLHLPLCSWINDYLYGEPNAGVDMNFNFAELIAHAAKTRDLVEGTIIGSGTVSNKDASFGVSCVSEIRMLETIHYGSPKTDWLSFGDKIKIEMLDSDGNSLFGAIEQEIVKA